MFRRPLSPKFHGAWLGAGSGTWLGTAIVALIQNYVMHHPLPAEVVALIIGLFGPAGAAVGSWLQPLAGNGQVLVDSNFARPPDRIDTSYMTVADAIDAVQNDKTPRLSPRSRRGAANAGEEPPAS